MFEVVSGTGSTLDLRDNNIYSIETQDVELVTGFAALSSYQFGYNNYYATVGSFSQVPTGGVNNIQVDPQFVSWADENYDIKDSSPLHNAGVILT
jgi:hypothetical protein